MKHKIALIEVGAFHDECLHSQIQYLKGDEREITLFCNSLLKPRINDLPDVVDIVYLDLGSKFRKHMSWYKTWRRISKRNFNKVIFNSAESNIYKLISYPYPRNVELIGTLHNAHNLIDKTKQKRITKKLDTYLVLNDLVKETIIKEELTNVKVGAYYPIVFPQYKQELIKPKDQLWITIPGVIAFDKRDYGIFENWKLPNHVKIIFLGRANEPEAKEFLAQAKSFPSYENFIFFDSFISNDLFHDYIRNSDYIMPLIHPENEFFERFLKYKITGSYNLAFGYKIPLLMDRSFSHISDFQENAIFYDYRSIQNIFEKIENHEKIFYQDPKWRFEFQKKNYLDLIFAT